MPKKDGVNLCKLVWNTLYNYYMYIIVVYPYGNVEVS